MFFTIGGYINYKHKNLKRWEDGIWHFIYFLYGWLFKLLKPIKKVAKFIIEKITADDVVDNALLLTNQECLDIVQEFENHPYESPALANNPVTSDNIQQLDIQAVGLVPKYNDTENKDLKIMINNTIQTYCMRTRERQIDIEISIVTPTRLLIEIPLSNQAKKKLTERKYKQTDISPKTSDVLEEEINSEEVFDLFEDSGK